MNGRPVWRSVGTVWMLVCGAMHAASLSPWCAAAHPMAPALVQTLAMCGLLWSLAGPAVGARRAGWYLWVYASVWLIGATGWMYVSLHRYGGLPGWLAGLAVALLCAALSLYMALAGWGWGRWRRRLWWQDSLLFSAMWLLAELARAAIFTGFPWGTSGYGLLDSPLDKLAPWLGVYGLGAVWAWVLSSSVFAVRADQRPFLRWGVLVLVLTGVGGLAWWKPVGFTQPFGQSLTVTLLQGNVPQDEKFAPDLQIPMLMWHARQLEEAAGTLVIAPETAIPLLPSQLPPGYWDQLKGLFGGGSGRYALIGVPLGDFESGYTNSIAGLSAESMAGPQGMYRYDKHHLEPFGEFIPNGFHWFVHMMNMPLGDFTRGPLVAPPFAVREQRIGPNICYEDLYGEEIAARFANASQAPTILVNVSNLAWFGEEVAIHQHLQIARMRSLEFQLPTLRATNTGATVMIDHLGRVVSGLPFNTRGVLDVTVQGREGVTPFAWWASRWGLLPLVVVALLAALAGAWGSLRRRDDSM
jgi:apolipoprotein N-acyltransferase